MLVCLGLGVAVLDGIGLSFLLPIVDRASDGGVVAGNAADGQVTAAFAAVYGALGVPFTLGTVVAGAAVVLGVRFGATILLRVLRVRFVTDYGRAYRRALFARTLGVDVAYLDERGGDDLLNAIVTESGYAASLLASVLAFCERALLTLVYLAVMVYLAPWLTLFALAVLGAITLAVRWVVEPASVSGKRVSVANRAIHRAARAGVQGARDVKLYGREPAVLDEYGAAVDERASAIVRLRRNEAIVGNLHQFASAAVVLGLVYLAVVVADLSLGALGAFLFAMLRTAPNVSGLQALVYSAAGVLPHVTGVRELATGLTDHAERGRPVANALGRTGTDPAGRAAPGTDHGTPASAHAGGRDGNDEPDRRLPDRIDRIAFEAVRFGYDDADDDPSEPRADAGWRGIGDRRGPSSAVDADADADADAGPRGPADPSPVLRDVSVTADRGELVGLVGTSGAGKSTLVSLLTRLYEPTGGTITADGVPIDAVELDAWRDRIAVVRQDPYVFADTLRANVLVGDPAATDVDVERACRHAGVAAFLDALPDGLDTQLGDDGVRLSGGQRQRVALARALLKLAHADVLVLDEATSNLDAETEAAVYRTLAEVAADRIVVVVTHRLSTLADADRVYVLSDGGVAEVGTHADLLAREGVYARLFAARHGTGRRPDPDPVLDPRARARDQDRDRDRNRADVEADADSVSLPPSETATEASDGPGPAAEREGTGVRTGTRARTRTRTSPSGTDGTTATPPPAPRPRPQPRREPGSTGDD
jgi:subfamily B ATP-binding cassette protein MsbA